MSLPPSFETPSEYFHAATEFLKEFAWIYKSSNTRFLAENVLDNFPLDWISYFNSISQEDLKNFPRSLNVEKPPSTLQDFQNCLDKLKPNHKVFEYNGKDVYFKRMSPKKLHEISRLSSLIGNTCRNDIDVFLDFGSGLGYLSEILHRQYKFNILGLECREERVKAAHQRQDTCYPHSKKNIYYMKEMITDESYKVVTKAIQVLYGKFEKPKLAIVGLHACADLSITSMKLFFHIENVKRLINLPCCYHKLQESTNCSKNEHFENFPLSQTLTQCINKIPGLKEVLNRPFLRLACQETVSRWSSMSEFERTKRGKEMFLRGVVECLPDHNEYISKLKKKTENQEKYECFFEEMKNNYQIQSKSGGVINWDDRHRTKLYNIFSKFKNGEKLAEGLICLQTALQEVCENVVLLDRVLYMQEYGQQHGISVNSYVIKVMDDGISPRCFALISEKL